VAGLTFDLIIIGAGPAGLFTAIHAARSGRKVCILEKNHTAGAKLLLTGGGKCNLTHSGTRDEFLAHYGAAAQGRFVKPALYSFTNSDLCRFFEERGVALLTSDDGKVFPRSMRSSDIMRVLENECGRLKVEIRYGDPVKTVERTAAGFSVSTAAGRCETRSVLIATGGASYPKTGSTGDGYVFAQRLGHTLVPPVPALSPVAIREYQFGGCSGISIRNAKIVLSRGGKKTVTAAGDVLFTHHGLSGPGILDLSRHLEPGDTVAVSLFSCEQYAVFESRFAADLAGGGRNSLKLCLKKYGIPGRLLAVVAASAGSAVNAACSTVDKKTRAFLQEHLARQPFVVECVCGFDQAMITKGGIPLCEVTAETLESRVTPGLFFAGEILDVDGNTGGYNLQFAFSSGWLVGNNVSR
jgi:predicted Rossmann fold flavoprotein